MHLAGEDPRAIDAILITHEHQDHVQGVSVLARKLGIPVYFTEMTHRAWVRWLHPEKRMTYADWLRRRQQESSSIPEEPASEVVNLDAMHMDVMHLDAPHQEESKPERDPAAIPAVAFFEAGKRFAVGDIGVEPFTIPHDAADPVGFVFEGEGVRIGFATDLGYMPANARQALRGCDVLLLESNHDTEMLRDGPYPWSVKQRVMSRVGHLSNEAAAEFLERNYDGQAAYIVLAHLSESNNLPALARVSAERALRDRMSLLANKLLLASQREPLAAIAL